MKGRQIAVNARDAQNDDLGSSLINSIVSPAISDISQDAIEIALDSLLEDGLVREIPVVKLIVAVGKTVAGIRERIFVKKVLRFYAGLSSLTVEEKEKFLRDMESDEQRKRLGETLVMILDRYDHLEKPDLLAKLFIAHVRGEIDFGEFQRLSLAVDRTFIQDLYQLLDFFTVTEEGKAKNQWAPWDRLYSSGLSSIEVHVDVEEIRRSRASGPPYHPVTEQRVSYGYSQDAETLARIILDDRFRFTRRAENALQV